MEQVKLGAELRATMGSASGNDLAAFAGGHSATESRDAGVLFFRWLVSLVCWHTIFLLAAL